MSSAASFVAALASAVAACAHAAESDPATPPAPAGEPAWEWAVTAYPTDVRGGDRFTSFIAAADRGALHLEARHNYESVGSSSAFVGYGFSGSGVVGWEVRPIVGGAWGNIHAFIPGVEASASLQRFDVYVEAEYVRDSHAQADSYFYAWSELGFRPVEWLRVGIAGQRTRTYDNDRDVQRGPFVQFTWSKATVGAYWFNPGSREQVLVGSLGVAF